MASIRERLAGDAGCNDVCGVKAELGRDVCKVCCDGWYVWVDNCMGACGIRVNVNCGVSYDPGVLP